MAEIQVSLSTLQAKREDLEQENIRLKDEIAKLEATEQNLATMWEGDAQAAFHNAFMSDKLKMDNFVIAINQYITALDEIITQYRNAESQNVGTATQRTY